MAPSFPLRASLPPLIEKNKAAFFVQGLIFSLGLLEYMLVNVMMDHLTDEWELHLPHAAAIVNVREGFTAVLSVYVAHVSDYHLGHYWAVLCSIAIYVSALAFMILVVGSPGDYEIAKLCIALALLSVGRAGTIPLKSFIDDQLRKRDPVESTEDLENQKNTEGEQNPEDSEKEDNKSGNDEQPKKRIRVSWWRRILMKVTRKMEQQRDENTRNLWWNIPWGAGIFASYFLSTNWKNTVTILAIVMASSLLWFGAGKWFGVYEIRKVTLSPLAIVYYVIKASISKRNLPSPRSPDEFVDNERHHMPLLPVNEYLRWLDKAAVNDNTTGEEHMRRVFKVADVEEVKYFLSILPLLSTLILYGVVKSTGSTFFIIQVTSMESKIPVVVFQVISVLACSIAARLGMTSYSKLPLRIGSGMICCFLCCVSAVLVQLFKLHHQISIFCLVPQFVLLGVMSGLAEKGLAKFLADNVSESMARYGPHMNECIIGIGNFISALLVIRLRGWFTDDLNTSRLDRYYGLQAVLSFVNIFLFRYVIKFYAKHENQTETNSVYAHELASVSVESSSQPEIRRQPSIRRRPLTRKTTLEKTNIQASVVDAPIYEEQYLLDDESEHAETSGEDSGGYAEEEQCPEEAHTMTDQDLKVYVRQSIESYTKIRKIVCKAVRVSINKGIINGGWS